MCIRDRFCVVDDVDDAGDDSYVGVSISITCPAESPPSGMTGVCCQLSVLQSVSRRELLASVLCR